MLDTRFPRPRGDIGNPSTFDFPVLYKVVVGATPERVVSEQAAGLVDRFCDGARELESRGVAAIATSCGFLALHQRRIASAVSVPVFTSSLLQIPTLLASLRLDQKIGVLTFDAAALSPGHFAGAGVTDLDRLAIAGMENAPALYRPLIENRGPLDVERARAEVVAVAESLVAANPDLAVFVLECTNQPPYADAIGRATELPVFDVVTMLRGAAAATSVQATPGDESRFI